MGDYCHISANCTFLGGNGTVSMGNFVNIAPGCRFVTAGHDYRFGGLNGPSIPDEFKGDSESGDIVLADHVLIGANSVILPGVKLPEGVAIGALSLVKNMAYRPWSLYAGIPARRIGQRRRTDILAQAKRLTDESNIS